MGTATDSTMRPRVSCLGWRAGSSGVYELSGTGALSAQREFIGVSGQGTFRQTGGTNTVNGLHVGGARDASGAYELSGTGVLSAGSAS